MFGADRVRTAVPSACRHLQPGPDAAISDAYNTEGYGDYLTVRGFVIDNRFNYRRDGLIIAETDPAGQQGADRGAQGTSGMQAGTSAPGGLVNFVVKRPPTRCRALARVASDGMRDRAPSTWSQPFGDGEVSACASTLRRRI